MDAAEADSDVKLYKASGELLGELQAKLPLLVASRDGQLRRWVVSTKTYELMKLFDAFQEWPQLLDPVLAKFVQILTDAFLAYCVKHRNDYIYGGTARQSGIEPLPRSICQLLYVLCKVRGNKIIVRLLNNEPKYVETILVSFRLWSFRDGGANDPMVWQERYIMLLWLSHLMLAPFELSSISTVAVGTSNIPTSMKVQQLPSLAKNLLSLALDHLSVPSKDREAAGILAVRIALRGDMQRVNMPSELAKWCIEQISEDNDNDGQNHYHRIGILTLVFGLVHSASDSEAAPFALEAYDATYKLAISTDQYHSNFRDAAPSRKLLVKIMRTTLEHSISLAASDVGSYAERLDTILENGIDILLQWLADTDTPVRQAVSKALSIVVYKLDADMSAEVIDAVLQCLEENLLLEDPKTGALIPATSVSKSAADSYRKNVNAVDPLRWHGAMLTLGHLLFRRSPPVYQLPKVIDTLIMGLQFEQRSNVGTSIGVGVRDAACFGIWSLSRKYSTTELLAVLIGSRLRYGETKTQEHSILQTIATDLVVSSCLDPSGNLRRGSSAALQELIGRHPDAILQGISIVQAVDYHAVARRSRAVLEVSLQAAHLDSVYHDALLTSLLDWRGVRSTDAESRWQAATAIGNLFNKSRPKTQSRFAGELITQVMELKRSNVGSTASARQGLLGSVAAIVIPGSGQQYIAESCSNFFSPLLHDIPSVSGELGGRVTSDLVNVLTAVSKVIHAGALSESTQPCEQSYEWYRTIEDTLHRCITASEDENVARSAAQANHAIFKLLASREKQILLKNWLSPAQNKKSEYYCKGRILSLSLLYPEAASDRACANFCLEIINYMNSIVSGDLPIETKVNAMQGVTFILAYEGAFDDTQTEELFDTLMKGLSDYTVDQRGDVGSMLRLKSLTAVQIFASHVTDTGKVEQLIANVARLAAERLTKVRFEAWKCLEIFWRLCIPQTPVFTPFNHQAEVSSALYYKQLAQLFQIHWIHDGLVLGFTSSVGAGTDDIGRACSEGLISFLLEQPLAKEQELIRSIVSFLIKFLASSDIGEDRQLIPILDFLTLIIEQFSVLISNSLASQHGTIFEILNRLQSSAATMERVEALVRLYLALTMIEGLQTQALDQLTRKLLHKWPKIRGLAADAIFLCRPDRELTYIDWNAPATQNKAKVVELRKQLGVAGTGANKVAATRP